MTKRLTAIAAIGFVAVMLLEPVSSAGATEYAAVEPIALSYEIALTSASTGITWPSTVLVTSATLDTVRPGDQALRAPHGEIYLSVQLSS